jgi:defect-in-organelle-trafficking protein DotD
MNPKRLALFIALLFLLAGCAGKNTVTFRKPPVNRPSDDATIKLAEAAVSVSGSMLEMARVEKVIYPHHNKNNRYRIQNAYSLQARATVDWSGPIEELVARITAAAHFRFHVLGQAPPVPVLISISAKDRSLVELLRDIDYQAGKKANIYVFPQRQVIELRYVKMYS